jgi:prepilin-type N-terminal cleavage/methylation domain-containing protein
MGFEPIHAVVITMIKKRLASEHGFTLIELLVVLNILGILVAMAVPSYIGFRATAQAAATSANVKAAVPAAEAYFLLTGNGSYTNLSSATLRLQTAGLDPSPSFKAGPNAAKNGYCVEDTIGAITYSYTGGIGGTAILTPSACDSVAYTVA